MRGRRVDHCSDRPQEPAFPGAVWPCQQHDGLEPAERSPGSMETDLMQELIGNSDLTYHLKSFRRASPFRTNGPTARRAVRAYEAHPRCDPTTARRPRFG